MNNKVNGLRQEQPRSERESRNKHGAGMILYCNVPNADSAPFYSRVCTGCLAPHTLQTLCYSAYSQTPRAIIHTPFLIIAMSSPRATATVIYPCRLHQDCKLKSHVPSK